MKKMRKEKLFFLVLTGLLAFSMIACNRSGSGSAQGTGPATAAGGRSSITVQIFDRGTDGGRTDPTNNNWTDWIRQKVLEDENLEVTFVRVSRWEETTALNNLMAAGNPPDVCLTYSPELVARYRDLGGLLDLAPYIDTLLVDMKKFLGPDEALPGRDLIRRNQDIVTGSIFSVPARRTNIAMRNTFIREDWLNALGLPPPRTTEEFYRALIAFRDRDPGGVGRNLVPFIITNDVRWTAGNLLFAHIDPTISTKEYWINTVVDRHILLPGYKDGVRVLNRWFNEGLIDPNFPLYTQVQVDNLIKSGAVGAFISNWDQPYRTGDALLQDLQSNVPGANFIPIDPFESRDGVRHKQAYDAAGLNIFVPRSTRNSNGALRYINWMARFENYHFLQIGPEGIVHNMVNGVPSLMAAEGPWIQNSAQNIDYTIHVNGLELGSRELNARALASAYPWPDEVIANAYYVATSHAAPGPVVPVDLIAANAVSQTLVDKASDLIASSITGSPANFDRTWDAGIADWMQSGAQAVIDERRAKYPPDFPQ